MAMTSELSIRFLSPCARAVHPRRADLVKVGRRSIVGNVSGVDRRPVAAVAVAQGTYVPPAR
jgi:acyl-coenzyme A thioesterase PaaI-like protein